MKDKILYITILILLILLMFTCGKQVNCSKPDKIKKDSIITERTDTIWMKDTIIKFEYKTVTKPIVVYKNPIIEVCDDSIREYTGEFNDSNLTVYSSSKTKGKLLENEIKYKLKIPLKIIDSVFVKTSITEIKKTRKVLVGINAQFYPIEPHISPIIIYQDKKDRLYNLQYDVMTGGVSFGFSTKLKFFNKNSR